MEADVEEQERTEVRIDHLTSGMVILAVEGNMHDPCWRKVDAVYRRDTSMKPGSREWTKERWQIWFDDVRHPMGLVVYGDDRKFRLGTEADIGTEVAR